MKWLTHRHVVIIVKIQSSSTKLLPVHACFSSKIRNQLQYDWAKLQQEVASLTLTHFWRIPLQQPLSHFLGKYFQWLIQWNRFSTCSHSIEYDRHSVDLKNNLFEKIFIIYFVACNFNLFNLLLFTRIAHLKCKFHFCRYEMFQFAISLTFRTLKSHQNWSTSGGKTIFIWLTRSIALRCCVDGK